MHTYATWWLIASSVALGGGPKEQETATAPWRAWTALTADEDFYVKAGNAQADVFVVWPQGRRKYIKTERDSTKKDNLLSLPECPT